MTIGTAPATLARHTPYTLAAVGLHAVAHTISSVATSQLVALSSRLLTLRDIHIKYQSRLQHYSTSCEAPTKWSFSKSANARQIFSIYDFTTGYLQNLLPPCRRLIAMTVGVVLFGDIAIL